MCDQVCICLSKNSPLYADFVDPCEEQRTLQVLSLLLVSCMIHSFHRRLPGLKKLSKMRSSKNYSLTIAKKFLIQKTKL